MDTLLDTEDYLVVTLSIRGIRNESLSQYECEAKLIDKNAKVRSHVRLPLTADYRAALPVEGLPLGDYQLLLSIHDGQGEQVSGNSKAISIIRGF